MLNKDSRLLTSVIDAVCSFLPYGSDERWVGAGNSNAPVRGLLLFVQVAAAFTLRSSPHRWLLLIGGTSAVSGATKKPPPYACRGGWGLWICSDYSEGGGAAS